MKLAGITSEGFQRLAQNLNDMSWDDFKNLVDELQQYERNLAHRMAQQRSKEELTDADMRIKDLCIQILDEMDRTSDLRHWCGTVAGELAMGTPDYEDVMNRFYNVVTKLSEMAEAAGNAYDEATSAAAPAGDAEMLGVQ